MSNVAEPASGATYRVLRELGARFQSSYAAIRGPRELVVLHRFAVAGRTSGAGVIEVDSSETLAAIVAEADSIARSWHPNVARVRNVDLYPDEQVAIATELVDGATLEDLTRIAQARSTTRMQGELSLPVLVRVLLDTLAGLHALHALRDPSNRRLGAVHGALAPANVVVGRDGVARLVNVLRPRGPRLTPASEALGYAAPEVLEGGPVDGRADVYSAGVVLWEALTGRRLWTEASPERLRARQRAEDVPPAPPVTSFGLEHLPAVALRALAFDPVRRFRSAADMASELRRPRDAQIASGAVVAAAVAALDGDRIRGRRARLDPSSSGARPRPTDEQIEEHLLALEPVEAPPAVTPTPPRPRTGSVRMPESEGLIPTAAYAPALPAPAPALDGARATLPSSTSSVTSELDGDPEPAAGPSPRRRRVVAPMAALLLCVVVVLAGIRALAPPPPALTFTTEPTGLPPLVPPTEAPRITATIEPVPVADVPLAPAVPPGPETTSAPPVATFTTAPSSATPAKARRYEPLGI